MVQLSTSTIYGSLFRFTTYGLFDECKEDLWFESGGCEILLSVASVDEGYLQPIKRNMSHRLSSLFWGPKFQVFDLLEV